MNKKTVLFLILGCVVLVIVAIICSVIFSGSNLEKLSRKIGWTSSVEKPPLPPIPEIPKNPYELEPDPELVKKYENSESEFFEYKLKDEYYSREEIKQEQINLSACLNEFQSNLYSKLVPDDVVHSKEKEVEPLYEKLREWEAQFPPSKDEIYHKKQQHLYGRIVSYAQEYRTAIEYHWHHQPTVENLKKFYELAIKVQEDFESGKITIDEALVEIGLEIDEYGDSIRNIPDEEIETEYIYE